MFLTGKSKENGAEAKDMAHLTCKTQIPPQIGKNKLTKDILTVFEQKTYKNCRFLTEKCNKNDTETKFMGGRAHILQFILEMK